MSIISNWYIHVALTLVIIRIYASEPLHLVTSDDKERQLNILILGDPVMSHLPSLLSVGEELASRDHNVTLCLVIDKDEHDKYRAHIRPRGIHLWMIDPEDVKTLTSSSVAIISEKLKDSFVSTMINEFGVYMANMQGIMMKHINKSILSGEWDVLLSTQVTQVAVSCISLSYKIPSIIMGVNIPSLPHLDPSWPFPNMLHGASSDNLGFVDRFFSSFHNHILRTVTAMMLDHSIVALTDYCPSLTDRVAMIDAGFRFPVIIPSVIGFDYSQPIWPLTSYVGALISKPSAILSGELKEWLGSKPDRSVIYISMGSLFNLDMDSGMAILEGIMNTNYSILWSLRKSNQWILEGVELDADRVLISEWTPQFSVLGSRAIHSAILHGGFNGLSEALWNGVPVIAFPQMAEQIFNAGRLHFNRLGIYVDKVILSSSVIAKSIEELDTGEYRENVAKIQKMFRLAGGAKRAADLVEFYEEVGYDHLVPSFVKYQWSWVQYYNADVYALLMVILLVMAVSFIACCRCICNRCIHHSGDKKIKKN